MVLVLKNPLTLSGRLSGLREVGKHLPSGMKALLIWTVKHIEIEGNRTASVLGRGCDGSPVAG